MCHPTERILVSMYEISIRIDSEHQLDLYRREGRTSSIQIYHRMISKRRDEGHSDSSRAPGLIGMTKLVFDD